MAERTERIDLDRPRELGDLITVAFNLFTRHFSLVFTLALIVTAPIGLLIGGVWGRSLADGADTELMVGPTPGSASLPSASVRPQTPPMSRPAGATTISASVKTSEKWRVKRLNATVSRSPSSRGFSSSMRSVPSGIGAG